MPKLQTYVATPNQGCLLINLYSAVAFPLLLKKIFIVLDVVQRCKHFEIGGDKKGKGTSLF